MTTTNMVQMNFEPVVAETMRRYGDFDTVCLASIAVSLKRLADAAEKVAECADGIHLSAFRTSQPQ